MREKKTYIIVITNHGRYTIHDSDIATNSIEQNNKLANDVVAAWNMKLNNMFVVSI